jgi:glycine/D-amino acid oxidase-like deaminating enzyme
MPSATPTRYKPLSGKHETDVAIVGGGMTGALVAHAFASAGAAVAVVEAGLVGRGSTVASSALLLPEPDLELVQLEARYGQRSSRRIWRLGQESVKQLSALITGLRIRCELRRRDSVYFAIDEIAARRLEREYGLRRRAGFEAEWLSPGALRRLTGISGRGAIRTRGSAQFDPYRACLGVIGAAARAGAEIFERSPVRRIDVQRDCVQLLTNRGSLSATHVVIATGYATSQFRPLAGRFRMYRTYVLATERIDDTERDELGLADVMLWDTERPYHYARWTPDRRLLLGGGDRLIRPGQQRQRQFEAALSELREYFEARLPALATIGSETAWDGMFAMTPDGLPYIGPHRRYPRHWFALGYGGNGMTFGFLAARMLLERWLGSRSSDHALFEFCRFRRA